MNGKQAELNSADIDLGFDGASFIFVTDIHTDTNFMRSPALIKYLQDHTAVKMVVCGGDLITGYGTKTGAINQLTKWRNAMAGTGAITLNGNHDANSNGQTDSTAILSKSAFYGLIDRETERDVNWVTGTLYGYMDNVPQKIKYIFLDTGAPDGASVDTAQRTWFKGVLTAMETGWTAVIFAHQFWTNTSKDTDPSLDANGTKILDDIEDVIGSMSAKIACIVAGHAHRDIVLDTEMGFYAIGTTCDTAGTSATNYDPDNPTRTEGTTTEQAFDIFYVNTNAKTVKTIRIGAGDTTANRSLSYT